MKYKTYKKCKDSGVEWLGEIPERWEVKKLKYILSSLESGSRESQDNLSDYAKIPSIGGEHITWEGNIKFTDNKFISENYFKSLKKGRIKNGDTLLVKDGATIGKTAFVKFNQDMAVNEHVFILRPSREINSKLIYYLIISDKIQRLICILSQGAAQAGLSSSFASNIFITFPNKIEQDRLINFLDQKTTTIDQLIKKNKKLIKLLEEKRQTIITQAVTEGLDLNVRKKDSKVEWLRTVSKGWSEIPFKQAIINDTTKGKGLKLPFVALENIVSAKGRLIKGFSWNEKKADDCSIFKKGDTLFGKLRPYLAKSFIADRNGCCPTELLVLRPRKGRLVFNYLHYLTLSKWFVDLCGANSYGVKMPRISWEKFSQRYVSLPPMNEQMKIANFIESQAQKIDLLVDKVNQQNKKLEEYRQAFISNAVTGKIRV